MRSAWWAARIAFLACGLGARTARAEIAEHVAVRGANATRAEIVDSRGTRRELAWDDLGATMLAPGKYTVSFTGAGDTRAVEIPACSGRGRVTIDGVAIAMNDGPVVADVTPRADEAPHVGAIALTVGGYEHRVACGAPPRFGERIATRDGLTTLAFASPSAAAGGGRAVVFVPPGHDVTKPGALLVGTHPWDGSMWTYAAYAELLREAAARDVVLLMPSGLGNSLYTAAAEDEVLRALQQLEMQVAIDPLRVSIWGASMGGAGATTIGFHHPDRFAAIVSLFGDSKYDLHSYVRAILPDENAAHLVNALDVADNVRNVPVWLIHGEDDRVSSIVQSDGLARELARRGFAVRFDRVPHAGHEGVVVARFLPEIVALAGSARATPDPAHVTYRSVRGRSPEHVYGMTIEHAGTGDAFVDVERTRDGVLVHAARNVRAIEFSNGALGAHAGDPILVERGARGTAVRWKSGG